MSYNIYQILRSDKVNAPFPANRYFKGTKRIVKSNGRMFCFCNFSISFRLVLE